MNRFIQKWVDWWRGNLFGATRSGKWSSVRKDFLIIHDTCAVCGKKAKLLKPLEVHHCIPFSRDISKELDFKNLITLCRTDHLFVGHLNSWSSWNINVREDAEYWKIKISNRPYGK